ncbi:MAG: sigma 54-interacting transcriptional regulator [Myxococcales bacterium]|nr:sigma 54-interacting transcriptional regulator [Myxococcales bacterium]
MYSPDSAAIGRGYNLSNESWTIGRAVDGVGQIADDALSRSHVRITPEAGAVYLVEDLGTSNGTFINGLRIEDKTPLEVGSVLAVGETLMVMDASPPRDSMPARDDIVAEIPEIVGDSLVAARLRHSIATIAPISASVLLLGPTGSGKEVAARAIGRLSHRKGPFVPVNCAAIPNELAEAELFGYTRGAFTGATSDHEGYFSQANGGTLFLDEVGDLPEPVQAKLLRVIETNEIQRLGDHVRSSLELRVIAATHKNLDAVGFRKDLFARLGEWVLNIPSLAERKTDILTLFTHFLQTKASPPFTFAFAEALLLYHWPMNVRELRTLALRLSNLHTHTRCLDVEDLPELLLDTLEHRFEEDPITNRRDTDPFEVRAPPKTELEQLLAAAHGNVSQAAHDYGCHRNQLYRWLRRRNIDPRVFRPHE